MLIDPQLVKNAPHFAEPEGSLPCLQLPPTFPYPEPDWSSQHLEILFKTHFSIMFPSPPRSSKWFLYLRPYSYSV